MASCRPAHHLAAPSGSVPNAARSGAYRSAVCLHSAVQLAPTISQHCSAGPTLPPLAVTWLHRCRDMWCWTGPTPSSSGWKSTSIPSLVRAWPAGQRRLHARLGPRQHAVGRPCTGRPARTRELAPASAEPSACLKAAHTLDRRRTALPRPGLSRRELHLDGRGGALSSVQGLLPGNCSPVVACLLVGHARLAASTAIASWDWLQPCGSTVHMLCNCARSPLTLPLPAAPLCSPTTFSCVRRRSGPRPRGTPPAHGQPCSVDLSRAARACSCAVQLVVMLMLCPPGPSNRLAQPPTAIPPLDWAPARRPAAFPFFYIEPVAMKSIIDRFNPKKVPIDQFEKIGALGWGCGLLAAPGAARALPHVALLASRQFSPAAQR